MQRPLKGETLWSGRAEWLDGDGALAESIVDSSGGDLAPSLGGGGKKFRGPKFLNKGPSIKCVTLFLTNFDPPPPVTLCHTSRTPHKVRHISEHPPKNNPASICASELCKKHSYKYRVTAVLHCIVKKLLRN